MRRALCLLLAAAPLSAQITVPATVDTLPNGLRVIVHEDHSAPIVTVNTWYHVGSGSEKVGRTGFAHLFEHLMWMGSANAPYPQSDRMLEAAGASNNGSTTEDRTNYYNTGPKSSLELMLWLEADRMGGLLPPMDEEKVDRSARHRKKRATPELREPAYGKVADIMPPLMIPPATRTHAGDRIDDRPLRSVSRRREDFFRTWYAPITP